MAVTHVATGTKATTGTTTVSIASPAGTASGQMLLAFRAGWTPPTTWTDETDWTASGELTGGFNGGSVDNHITSIRADRRVLSGSLAGPTVFDQTHTSQTGTVGIMLSYQESGGGFVTPVTATGTDDTHGANRSITSSTSIALQVDDVVVVAVATDTDTNLASFANPAITASGITFGSTTRRSPASAGSTTGADGNIEVFEATVTSGSGTVAITLAFDTTTNQCGPGVFIRLREASTAVTGTIGATQTNDTSAISGQLGYSGTIPGLDADDTAAFSGTVNPPISGSIAATETDDTSAISGQLGVSGTIDGQDGDDTSNLSGQLGYSGSIAGADQDDTGAFTGQLGVSGTIDGVDQDDTANFSGTVTDPVTGTISGADEDDTAAFTGTVAAGGAISGSIAGVEQDDTSNISGQLGYSGTIAAQDENDTSNLSGQLGVSGTISGVDQNDNGAFTGQLGVSGTISGADQDDTAAFSGTFNPPVSGTISGVDEDDVGVFSGQLGVSGTIDGADQDDVGNFVGFSGDILYPTDAASSHRAPGWDVETEILGTWSSRTRRALTVTSSVST